MKSRPNKPPLSIVPRAAMEAIAAGLLDGEIRCGHGRNDWRTNDPSIYIDAALRHISAHNEGEIIDEVSGVDHLAKAIANLAMVLTINKYEFQYPVCSMEKTSNQF